MATINAINSNIPIEIAKGGTNATSMATSTGIVKYDGTLLVTSSTAKIDSSNRMTNTSQPAFFAYQASNITNATGNGANYQLGTTALTVSLNQGSCFNSNGTFTAPVTGVYLFCWNIQVTNLLLAGQSLLYLVADGISYLTGSYRVAAAQNAYNAGSILIPMTASSTATLSVQTMGEAGDTATVVGNANRVTYFSGYLVC